MWVFSAKMSYWRKQPRSSFVAFVLEVSTWKILLVVGDQLRKKLKKLIRKLYNIDI